MRTLTILAVLAPGTAGMAAAKDSPVAAESVLKMRKDYEAVVAARDRMAGELAAERQGKQGAEAGLRVSFTLADGLLRRPVSVELTRSGGAWVSSAARLPGYNKASCPIEASGLKLDAAGVLRGRIKITVVSDGFVPEVGTTHDLLYDLDASIRDGRVAGTYHAQGNPELNCRVPADQDRYDQLREQAARNPKAAPMLGFVEQMTVHEQPHDGVLAGEVVRPDVKVDPPKAAAPEPLEGKSQADLYAAATRLEIAAEAAYQSARAVDLAQRGFLDYSAALGLAIPRSPERPAFDPNAARTLADIGARIARQRELLEGRLAAKEPASVIVGRVATDDPDFLGYYGQEPLPAEPGKANVLPPAGDPQGPERWQFVDSWRIVGPIPRDSRPDLFTDHLPEMIEAPDGAYPLEKIAPKGPYFHAPGVAPEKIKWIPATGVPAVAPPWYTSAGRAHYPGVWNTMFYAAAEVDSAAEREVWAAIFADDAARLWVNDRLVWVGQTHTLPGHDAISVFQVRLKAGRNRLMVRCDNDFNANYFWMKLCTGGCPRPADRVEGDRKAQAQARAAMPPRQVRGWCGDGSTIYPDAKPATAWDVDKGINVLWRLPLRRFSIAHPVVVGDKVFTQMEPHWLICVDKMTGKLLWKRDSSIVEFLPEPDRTQALEDCAKEEEDVASVTPGPLKELTDQLEKLNEKLEAKPEDASLQREARALQDRIEELASQRHGISYWARKAGVRADLAGRGWNEITGYSAPTPVSDGQRIWVKYGTGVVACYDLDGNRKWIARTYISAAGGVTDMPSPVLAGNVLVIDGGDAYWRTHSKNKPISRFGPPTGLFGHWMIGMDADTGKILWDVGPLFNGYYGGPAGPLATRVTNGKSVMDIVMTGWGQVFRGSDGKELIHFIGAHCFYDTPWQIGDVVYFSKPLSAFDFRMQDANTVAAVPLRKDGKSPSGLYHKGLFYKIVGTKLAGGRFRVDVMDAATGRQVGTSGDMNRYPVAGDYAPDALAGDSVFICGDKGIVVTTTGLRPRCIAANRNERMTAAPVFDGERMYLRRYDSLICIALKDEEGRKYQRDTWAATIMESFPDDLTTVPVTKLMPRADLAALPETAVTPLRDCRVLSLKAWMGAGPFPAGKDGSDVELPKAIAEAVPKAGETVTLSGVACKWAAIDARHVMEGGGIDADGAVLGGRKGEACLVAVLNNPSPRFLQVSYAIEPEQDALSARLWIGGQAVKANDFLELPEAGRVPVVLRVRSQGEIPPFLKPTLRVALAHKENPNALMQPEVERTKADVDILKKVAEMAPGTEHGQKAAKLLKQLERR